MENTAKIPFHAYRRACWKWLEIAEKFNHASKQMLIIIEQDQDQVTTPEFLTQLASHKANRNQLVNIRVRLMNVPTLADMVKNVEL